MLRLLFGNEENSESGYDSLSKKYKCWKKWTKDYNSTVP